MLSHCARRSWPHAGGEQGLVFVDRSHELLLALLPLGPEGLAGAPKELLISVSAPETAPARGSRKKRPMSIPYRPPLSRELPHALYLPAGRQDSQKLN